MAFAKDFKTFLEGHDHQDIFRLVYGDHPQTGKEKLGLPFIDVIPTKGILENPNMSMEDMAEEVDYVHENNIEVESGILIKNGVIIVIPGKGAKEFFLVEDLVAAIISIEGKEYLLKAPKNTKLSMLKDYFQTSFGIEIGSFVSLGRNPASLPNSLTLKEAIDQYYQ